MVNPDSFPREAYLKITRKGSAGIIELRENDASILVDYELKLQENHPRTLTITLDNATTISTLNLLLSTCARWSSGTGAMAQGDPVNFGFYQPGTSTVDTWFDGQIQDIRSNQNGNIVLICKDGLERLEHIKKDVVIAKSKKDQLKSITWTSGYRKITGISEADIQTPFEYISICNSMATDAYGGGVARQVYDLPTNLNRRHAQAFVAKGWFLEEIAFTYTNSLYWDGVGPQGYKIYVEICRDNGNAPGAVVGTTMNHQCVGPTGTNVAAQVWPVSTIHKLAPGEKYWIVFRAEVAAGTMSIDTEDPTAAWTEVSKTSTDAGVTWAALTGPDSQLHLDLSQLGFRELEPSEYSFDDTTDTVWLYTATDVPYELAYLSYYYGTNTLEEIFTRMVKFNTFMNGDISTDCDITLKTYSTKGKTLADALRELLDTFETSGTFDDYQHAMAHYVDGSSISRCKIGKSLNIAKNAAVVTASYPEDRPSNSDEYIIVGEPQIQKTSKYKYSEVQVIGQTIEGIPLVCTRSDKGKTGSYWQKVNGMVDTLKVSRPDLSELAQVNTECFKLLDAVSKDVWEGSLALDGHQRALWDIDNTSSSYGSGKVLSVYWSPLGLSNTLFKIKQMIIKKFTTEVYLSSMDPLLFNTLTEALGTLERVEAYLAPIGLVDNFYIESYDDEVKTSDHNVYAKLYDESNTAISYQDQVLCTKFESTDYNTVTYHAEFEKNNGLAGTKVRYVELNTVEHGQLVKIDLNRTTSSIVFDEMGEKNLNNRLIVEITCKLA